LQRIRDVLAQRATQTVSAAILLTVLLSEEHVATSVNTGVESKQLKPTKPLNLEANMSYMGDFVIEQGERIKALEDAIEEFLARQGRMHVDILGGSYTLLQAVRRKDGV
jgi:hypothetical protein